MAVKMTKEDFLKRSREVHGEYYDYSKVEYVNARTKVCIICPEHGEFYQIPYLHLTGSGCYKCGRKVSAKKQSLTFEDAVRRIKEVHGDKDTIVHFERCSAPICVNTQEYGEKWFSDLNTYLKWKRTPIVRWTDETCEMVARKYKTKMEFLKNDGGAWSYAQKHGLLKKFDWFVKPPMKNRDEVSTVYSVYVYKDDETHSLYVGLTKNMKQRHSQHKRKQDGKYDTVGEYFHSIGKRVPDPEILVSGLNSNEASYYEGYYKEYYEKEGWNVINKAPCGVNTSSVGGTAVKWTYDKCFEAAKNCTSVSDFQNKYGGAFSAASKNKWMTDYTWFTYNDRTKSKKPIYQIDLSGAIVKRWNSSSDIESVLGFSHCNIVACCKGRRKVSNGFKWEYA